MKLVSGFNEKGIGVLSVFSLLFAVFIFLSLNVLAAQDEDGDVAPAPPSIGADVPLTYFGPAPSDVKKELIGPYQLLKSGKLDHDKNSITLPLYKGHMKDGRLVWYVVTDTTDESNAAALGLNHSPKLVYTDIGKAVRKATLEKGFNLIFESGAVDFSSDRSLVPGDAPNYFPPKKFTPGSIGDKDYSPLVKITNAGGEIL